MENEYKNTKSSNGATLNKNRIEKGKRHNEVISHFNCGACGKWWSIGDAPTRKKEWHCPWCGFKQKVV